MGDLRWREKGERRRDWSAKTASQRKISSHARACTRRTTYLPIQKAFLCHTYKYSVCLIYIFLRVGTTTALEQSILMPARMDRYIGKGSMGHPLSLLLSSWLGQITKTSTYYMAIYHIIYLFIIILGEPSVRSVGHLWGLFVLLYSVLLLGA